MTTVKVQYAKTHLSSILLAVEKGEEVTISRGDTPVARLVPLTQGADRELGFVQYSIPETFFEPLPADELAAWESAP